MPVLHTSLPSPAELPQRVRAMLHVIYLLFNEGYEASFGPALVRVDLCGESIRLARLIVEILPEAEIYGLLALMMFHHARRKARTGPSGELILLDDQDRSKWDRSEISQAEDFLKRALVPQRMGRYACEASIAQVHAVTRRPEETDWAKIVRLYDALLEIDPSPIIELNRAAAIAMRDGPAEGLAIMDDLISRGALSDYRFAHAARADMYRAADESRKPGLHMRGPLRLRSKRQNADTSPAEWPNWNKPRF